MDEPTGITRRFIDHWFSYRMAIGLFGTVILAALALAAPEPLYQISLEGLFPAQDPLIQSQQRAREAFGDNRFVLMAYEDPDVLTSEGVARTAQIESQIREIEGVRDVLCLATLDRQLRLLGTSIVASDVLAGRYRDMFLGFTHDRENKIAGFICLLARLNDLEDEGKVIAALRGVVEQPPTDIGRGIVVGEPVLIADAFASIRRDSVRLQLASTLLLALVLAVCLRSLRWVLVVFGIVQLSIMATVAVASLLQLRWSLLSSMLPAIIVVIGAGALTHLAVWSRRNLVSCESPIDATKSAVARVFWPVLATCVTDAMGFLALLVSPITPLREFALVVSVGILLFLVASIVLFPLLGCWALGKKGAPTAPPSSDAVGENEIQAFRRKAQMGLVAYTAFVLFAALGIPRLQLETDITKSFRADSELARSFRFVEKNLGGAGIWEVHIPVDGNVTQTLIDRVKSLSADLRELRVDVENGRNSDREYVATLTNVVSLADVVTSTDGSKNFLLANTPLALRLQGVRAAMPIFYDTLYGETDDGQRYLRLLVRSQDSRSVEWKRALISAVEHKVNEHFPPAELEAGTRTADSPTRVAGTFVVIAKMVERLVADQWSTLGTALVCVYATLLLFLKRPLVAAVALLPSLMAIVAILGVIGWIGIRIDLGVVMIAAVSLGMAVDGAIHMVNCIDREQGDDRLPDEAIVRGVRATGGPLAFATLAIVAGFSTLAVSDFMPSVTFGLLVGVATTIGLIGNLTVLPTLLSGKRLL